MKSKLLPNTEVAADLAAATSGALVGASWLGPANEIMQLIATVVAIVAGLYAIKWHRVRITNVEQKVREVHRVIVREETPDESQRESTGGAAQRDRSDSAGTDREV